MASFGEELKRERELRDISLREISEATKISIRFLEALELNNFDVLPGGIFNRGFIRAYARFIGVDGEEMVNAYLHEVALREARQAQSNKGTLHVTAGGAAGSTEPSPPGRAESRAPQRIESRLAFRAEARAEIPPEIGFSSRRTQDGNGGRTSLALWVLVAIALLIGLGVIAMSFMGGKPVDASAQGHAQALKARLSKKAAGPQQQPAATQEPGAAPSTDTPAQPSDQPGGEPDAPASAAPQSPPAAEHQVRIRVLEATRVIIECAGRLTLDQELWPGQSRYVTCPEPVVLSAGNGGAVEYSIDNGPPALLGEVGQQIEGLTVAPAAPAGRFGQDDKDPHAGR